MRYLLLVLVIVGGYVLVQGVRFALLTRASLQLVKQSMVYERKVEGGSPRFLIVGDSTGVGTGVEDSALSVAGRFGSEFPKAFIQNVSVNGWKVGDALRNFPDVPAKSFDVVLLQIGANDILRGTPMSEFSASLEELFLKSQEAGVHVYALHSGNIGLAPFFPWPLSWLMTARTRVYRAEYMRLAAKHGITYVDLFSEAAQDPFRPKKYFYAKDRLHLNAKGYGEWFASIRKVMGNTLD